jgi:hypothetical protein
VSAVAVLDAGDVAQLDVLLQHHPWLIRYRQRIGPWYDAGYFSGAMLQKKGQKAPDLQSGDEWPPTEVLACVVLV